MPPFSSKRQRVTLSDAVAQITTALQTKFNAMIQEVTMITVQIAIHFNPIFFQQTQF